MFDDVNPQQPNNQSPQEPLEDMFGDTDPVSAQNAAPPASPTSSQGTPAEQKPVTPGAPETPATVQPASYASPSSSIGKKILIFLVVIIIVAGLGVLGWWYYSQVLRTRTADVQVNIPTPQAPAENEEAAQVIPPEPVTPPAPPAPVEPEPVVEVPVTPLAPVDRDGDGLTDTEEAQYGTNPLLEDTDGDGLFDREEVFTYETDPLNDDTDGDTYLDGAEVQNGYNPNGPGQLNLQIPADTTTPTSN